MGLDFSHDQIATEFSLIAVIEFVAFLNEAGTFLLRVELFQIKATLFPAEYYPSIETAICTFGLLFQPTLQVLFTCLEPKLFLALDSSFPVSVVQSLSVPCLVSSLSLATPYEAFLSTRHLLASPFGFSVRTLPPSVS